MTLHVIEVLDRSGHLSLTWDPTIPESVERARAEFELLQQSGYQFFRVLNQDEPTGFAPQDGALVVKRVEAADVAPAVAPVPPMRRRGRPPKERPTEEPRQERTVAMRPMRGG
jgi:hypothetical protein